MKKLVVICACMLALSGQGPPEPQPTRSPTVEASKKYPAGTKTTDYFSDGATFVDEENEDGTIDDYSSYAPNGALKYTMVQHHSCNKETTVTTEYDVHGNITSIVSRNAGIHFASGGERSTSDYEVTEKTWVRDSSGRITAQVTTSDSASGSTGTLVQTRYDSPSDTIGSRETTALHQEGGQFVSSTGTPVAEYLGKDNDQPIFPSQKIAKNAAPEDLCNLSGTWVATFHNPEGVIDERIGIVQSDQHITATKITGDPYIPAGKVTIEGTFNKNPFDVQYTCAHKDYRDVDHQPAAVSVTDKDHFTLVSSAHGNCVANTEHWQRVK